MKVFVTIVYHNKERLGITTINTSEGYSSVLHVAFYLCSLTNCAIKDVAKGSENLIKKGNQRINNAALKLN